MKNLIALSVPIFFILIGLELLVGLITQKKYYRFNDAVTNLSCGIGSQVLGAFFGIITFFAYTYTYEHFKITTIPSNVFTWLLLFLGVDMAYYWFHRLSHEINAIWATHIVHHQSEEYNLSVALRQSWFQTLFSWWFYLPLAFLGFDPLIMGSIIALNTLYQFWIHTKAIKKFPRIIEFIFNTPSHHRVHHGTNPQYIDKNHAGSLIIWDRMFGTFQPEEEEVVYGITTPLKSFNPFWANFHYWEELFHNAKQASSFKEAVYVFTKPPGWYPEKMGGFKPAPPVDLNNVQKFDISVRKTMNGYILFQFTLILGIASYYMFGAKKMLESGNVELLISAFAMAMFILLSLFVFGLFFENKRSAIPWEGLRLLTSLGLLFFFRSQTWFMWALIGLGIINISSFVFLLLTQQKKETAPIEDENAYSSRA